MPEDSIGFGYTGEAVPSTGAYGVVATGLANQCPWMIKARPGESIQNWNGTNINQRFLDLDIVTHISGGLFINDRNNGRTYAQILADWQDFWAYLKIHNKTMVMRTACPLTLSTDSWATTANQTEFGITVTGATNASPIVIAWSGAYTRKVNTGDSVTITGVTGNTAANGTFTATYVDATHFSLQGSTGNGAYVSGGMTKCNTMNTDLLAWNAFILDTSAAGMQQVSGGVVVGYQDIGNAVMSAAASGKWKVDGTANKYTLDGIHPNNAGVILGASAVLLSAYV
jgi:hypothetical protein